MYALQRPQCNPRYQLPQVWLPESSPQEQGKKSIIFFFHYQPFFIKHVIKVTLALMPFFSVL
jgi:hypothetical protein